MDSGDGVYNLVYDGSYNSLTLEYTVTNLTTGNEYNFELSAVNANGESALSSS